MISADGNFPCGHKGNSSGVCLTCQSAQSQNVYDEEGRMECGCFPAMHSEGCIGESLRKLPPSENVFMRYRNLFKVLEDTRSERDCYYKQLMQNEDTLIKLRERLADLDVMIGKLKYYVQCCSQRPIIYYVRASARLLLEELAAFEKTKSSQEI